MGEKSNAERFLAAYQTIDEIVRKNANDVPEAKLVDVIPKAALSNYVIHMFTLSLQSLAEIRNAIVCDTNSSVILAEPSDAVVRKSKTSVSIFSAGILLWNSPKLRSGP
jgi:hypothetical protein